MTESTALNTKGPKPKLRGVSHLVGTLLAVPAAVALMGIATDERVRCGVIVYAICLVMLLGVSAFYHVPMWQPGPRARLRRVDRSMIYVFIAGTYTPLVLVLGDRIGSAVLPAVWLAALAGIVLTLVGSNLPRYVTATPYVVLGWGAVVIMPAVKEQFGMVCFWLIAAGGLAYTIGAIAYARRKPNPWPRVFGYHEIFHMLVLLGAAAHYLAIYVSVQGN
jgi:hemolysin III